MCGGFNYGIKRDRQTAQMMVPIGFISDVASLFVFTFISIGYQLMFCRFCLETCIDFIYRLCVCMPVAWC